MKQNCRKPKTRCQLPLLSTYGYLDFVTPTKIPYISRKPYTSSKKVKVTLTSDDSRFKLRVESLTQNNTGKGQYMGTIWHIRKGWKAFNKLARVKNMIGSSTRGKGFNT